MKYFLVLVIVVFGWNSFAQNKTFDDIELELNEASEDTTKLRLYAQLSNDINKSQRNDYGLKAIDLADKLMANPSLIRSEINKHKSIALVNLGLTSLNRGDFKRAINYLRNSLSIEESLGNIEKQAEINNHLGLVYTNKNEFYESLKYYNISQTMYQNLGNKVKESSILQKVGGIYNMKGDYTEALQEYQNGESLLLEGSNEQELAKLNLDIGDVYVNKKEYDKARSYFDKSMEYYKENELKSGQADVLNHIGVSYETLDPKKAIFYYEKSLKISKSIEDKFTMIQSYVSIAYAFENQKKYAKAIEYHTKSMQLSEEIGYGQGVAEATYSIDKIENK